MGEIADAMLDGDLDYITGEYIGEGVGYPRTFETDKKAKKIPCLERIHQKLSSRGFYIKQKRFDIIHEYGKIIGKESAASICKNILESPENKGKFSTWLNENGYVKQRNKKAS